MCAPYKTVKSVTKLGATSGAGLGGTALDISGEDLSALLQSAVAGSSAGSVRAHAVAYMAGAHIHVISSHHAIIPRLNPRLHCATCLPNASRAFKHNLVPPGLYLMSGEMGAAALLSHVRGTLASIGLDAAGFGDIVAEIASSGSGSKTIDAAYKKMLSSTTAVEVMFANAEVSLALLNFTSGQAHGFMNSVATARTGDTEVLADIISEAAIQVILDRSDVAVDLTPFAGCLSCASSAADISTALRKVVPVAPPGAAESTASASIRALFLGTDGEALSFASKATAKIDIFAATDLTTIAACYNATANTSLYSCAMAQMATSAKLMSVVHILSDKNISSAFTLSTVRFDYLVGAAE